jgi:hypothetical protein
MYRRMVCGIPVSRPGFERSHARLESGGSPSERRLSEVDLREAFCCIRTRDLVVGGLASSLLHWSLHVVRQVTFWWKYVTDYSWALHREGLVWCRACDFLRSRGRTDSWIIHGDQSPLHPRERILNLTVNEAVTRYRGCQQDWFQVKET